MTLAGGGLVAAGGLDAVDGVDATLAQALGVLEKQPFDCALGVGSGAGRSRCIGLVELAEYRQGVRRLGKLIKSEDWRGAAEEVVADQMLEAKGLQVLSEACGLGAEGECERGNGGDGPPGKGVVVEVCANVVEVGCIVSDKVY